MREIKSIQTAIYSEPDEQHRVTKIGRRKNGDVFRELEAHLKENGLLPDGYFTLLSYAQEALPEDNSFWFESKTSLWTNLGIYLNIYIYYESMGEIKTIPFAEGKTLSDSADDYFRMSLIGAECNLMLNGDGRVYRQEKELIPISEKQFGAVETRYIRTLEDGWTEKVAIMKEQDGYHIHYAYDEDKGKGASGQGPFVTPAYAEETLRATISQYGHPEVTEVRSFQEADRRNEEWAARHNFPTTGREVVDTATESRLHYIGSEGYYENSKTAASFVSFFKKESGALALDDLAQITPKQQAEKYIIAAPALAISSEELDRYHISFLKLGRDISPEALEDDLWEEAELAMDNMERAEKDLNLSSGRTTTPADKIMEEYLNQQRESAPTQDSPCIGAR